MLRDIYLVLRKTNANLFTRIHYRILDMQPASAKALHGYDGISYFVMHVSGGRARAVLYNVHASARRDPDTNG